MHKNDVLLHFCDDYAIFFTTEILFQKDLSAAFETLISCFFLVCFLVLDEKCGMRFFLRSVYLPPNHDNFFLQTQAARTTLRAKVIYAMMLCRFQPQ